MQIGLFLANPVPIRQSQANPPIQCQFQVITEAIPALNLGTSALYGMVPSLLGGRIMAQSSQLAKPSVSTEDNIEPTAIP